MEKKLVMVTIALLFFSNALAQDAAGDEILTAPDRWALIHAGTLIARPGDEPLLEQSIIVKNDRIHAISSGYVLPEVVLEGEAVTVINLKDQFVLPGLIDAHVHLGLGGDFDKGRDNETGQGAYRFLNIATNAQTTLNAGYTTVRNPGGYGWALFAYRDGVKSGVFPGPRIFTAGHTIKIGTFEGDGAGACYDVSSCKQAVRRQIEMGADWIKIYATCSGGKPCGREHAPAVFTSDEMNAVIETARTRQIPVAAHAHGTAGINAALRAGVRSIEHGSYNDAESRRLWKRNDAFYVPTLAVQDNILKDYETATDEMKPVMEAFMETHPSRVAAAFEAGVKIAAGSDAGVVPHGENAKELIWYTKIGMSEAQALRSATIVNAELLQMESDLGSVEVGKFADIIAVPSDPLQNIEALRDIGFVMAGGRVVKSIEGE